MNDQDSAVQVEDVEAALRHGRPVRAHGPYRVQVGSERLEFRDVVIEDPVPTGRQILEAAQVVPVLEHSVFQVLGNGLLEELRPDETTDLRASGVERFLVFRNDRSFRFELDGRVFEWGATRISGLTLKKLVGVDPASYGVWLDVPRGSDREIGDAELFDLSAPGVEKFFTGVLSIKIIVNGREKEVSQRALSFMDVIRLAYPDATVSETTIYTVNFSRGPESNPQGSMVSGQVVQLKNGMIFNVTATDKS